MFPDNDLLLWVRTTALENGRMFLAVLAGFLVAIAAITGIFTVTGTDVWVSILIGVLIMLALLGNYMLLLRSVFLTALLKVGGAASFALLQPLPGGEAL